MNPTEEQMDRASRNLSVEIAVFVHKIRQKCNCNLFEALLITRAIIYTLPDNLGAEALQEFEQFLAKVRKGEFSL